LSFVRVVVARWEPILRRGRANRTG